MNDSGEQEMTFWDHLEELRKVCFRGILAVVVMACVAFCFKDPLFRIILAPQKSDFVLYRFLNRMAALFSMQTLSVEDFHVDLINTQLTSQFMIHLSVSFCTGLLLASPYLIYLVFGFISPALQQNERQACLKVLVPAFLLFLTGLLLSYYLIFPLSFRFLASYQVSETVINMISLSSYISSFTMLSLFLGAAFEMPVIACFLARLKWIDSLKLKKFRKHSLIGILILSAIITPTSDVFTLLLVSFPLYLLYELSVWIVGRTNPL